MDRDRDERLRLALREQRVLDSLGALADVLPSPLAVDALALPKNGGKVTVSLKDAGVAIAGAKVRLGGTSKTTNSKGQATFSVAKHSKKGTRTITFTRDPSGSPANPWTRPPEYRWSWPLRLR